MNWYRTALIGMLSWAVTRSKTNKLRVIAHAAHCWAEGKIKLFYIFLDVPL